MPDSRELNTTTKTPDRRNQAIRYMSIFSIASSSLVFGCMGCCFLTSFVLRPKLLDSPAGAAEVAARITDWTVPSEFEGKSGTIVDNALVKVDFVKFVQKQGRGLILLGQFQSHAFLFSDQQSQSRQILERITPELKTLKVTHSRTLRLTIKNLPADFRIEQGEDRASTTRLLQVTGFFRGHRDDAILILQCEEGILSDEQIDQFLKSMK